MELREIAKMLGITPSNMKKQELLNKIIAAASEAATAENTEQTPKESAPKRGRRPRMSSVKVGGEEAQPENVTPEVAESA